MTESEVDSFVSLLRSLGIQELRIAGIAIPMIAELMPESTGMLINLILAEKSVRVRVAVKDTGIGIKPEDMGALFEEYERFDEKRNRKIEGTGLGLSITKELLELMGTRLKVESTYGEGSEFSFEIMQGVINDEPFGGAGGYAVLLYSFGEDTYCQLN